jgi:hypothetical protein
LSKHSTHKREIFIPPQRFEPAIPASERPQTHILDRAATGIGILMSRLVKNKEKGKVVPVRAMKANESNRI